jgi:hypothetical protein
MRKSLIVAGSALIFAVGAADIQVPKLGYDISAMAAAAMGSAAMMHPGTADPDMAHSQVGHHRSAAAPQRYRPCRRGPGDDRCIQLYERGVRLAYARWLEGEDRFVEAEPVRRTMVVRRREVALPYAVGGPVEHMSGYPECMHSTRDDRCIQAHENEDEPGYERDHRRRDVYRDHHPREDERMLDYGHDDEGTPGI